MQLGSPGGFPWRAASRDGQKFVWNVKPLYGTSYSAKLSGICLVFNVILDDGTISQKTPNIDGFSVKFYFYKEIADDQFIQ